MTSPWGGYERVVSFSIAVAHHNLRLTGGPHPSS
jgi:hypothetical protein